MRHALGKKKKKKKSQVQRILVPLFPLCNRVPDFIGRSHIQARESKKRYAIRVQILCGSTIINIFERWLKILILIRDWREKTIALNAGTKNDSRSNQVSTSTGYTHPLCHSWNAYTYTLYLYFASIRFTWKTDSSLCGNPSHRTKLRTINS